jgi:cGMP-dependent protein kinase
MTEQQKESVASILITESYSPGQIIVSEGDPANSYYIIKEGTVAISIGGKHIKRMKELETFGEQALMADSSERKTTVTAETEVTCISLGRDALSGILGDKISVIINQNKVRWALDNCELVRASPASALDKLAQSAKTLPFEKGGLVVERGTALTFLYIGLDDRLVNEGGETVAEKCAVYGPDSLVEKPRRAGFDVLAGGRTSVAMVPVQELAAAVEEGRVQKKVQIQTSSKKAMYNFEDMRYIRRLGAGQFGKVYLVQHCHSDMLFAIKAISKNTIEKESLQFYVRQELLALEAVSSPSIVSFYRAFRDKFNIYFLMEFVNGMELFHVIRKIGLLSPEESQFYTASILVCIMHLHERSIVYRDIKPENVLVEGQGLVKLIDLGTAKQLDTKLIRKGRTTTIIGTPHYMAPEIITGKGYSFLVDLWSLGICLYEFMCGGVPFAEESEDPYEIYE